MVWTTYKEKLKSLSQRIVDAQRPIRILDAIKWDPSVELELRKSHFKHMPKIGPEHYSRIPLGFEPERKLEELRDLARDVDGALGAGDALGGLLKRIIEQYVDVVHMLKARGTPEFWEYSKRLYGSPKDSFDEKNSIRALGE